MKSRAHLVVFLLSASSCTATAAAEPASLCREMAVRIPQSAPADTEQALNTWIVTAQPEPPDRWGPRETAMNARLRKVLEAKGALSEDGWGPDMEFDQLPHTSVFMGSVVAGTAECQTAAFAMLSSDGVERVLPEPAGYTGTCWNMHGSLATVLGHPAYVESGTVSSTSADAVVRVTPWTGHDWAAPCQLTVEFNYTLTLAQQFCSDAVPCRAAASIAPDIARRYVAYRAPRKPPMRSIDDDMVPDFIGAAGIVDGPRAQALVNAGWVTMGWAGARDRTYYSPCTTLPVLTRAISCRLRASSSSASRWN
jgi:hypothetical protein